MDTWPAGAHEKVVRVSVASHRQVRFLLQELDRQFPDVPLPLGTTIPLILVGHDTTLHLARDPDNREHVYYFCLCLRMLLRMAEAFAVAPVIMQGLLRIARRQGVVLPLEAKEIECMLRHTRFAIPKAANIHCSLPIDLGLMQTDDQGSRLESIIKHTNHMSLE